MKEFQTLDQTLNYLKDSGKISSMEYLRYSMMLSNHKGKTVAAELAQLELAEWDARKNKYVV